MNRLVKSGDPNTAIPRIHPTDNPQPRCTTPTPTIVGNSGIRPKWLTDKFREACLTCPMFLTTPEFLPQHRTQREQTLQLITAAEARGHKRLAEMNRQVLGNLDAIITSLDTPTVSEGSRTCELTTAFTSSTGQAASRAHPGNSHRRLARTRTAAGTKISFEAVAGTAVSPGPGSTPSPTSKTRSTASVRYAARNTTRLRRPGNAPRKTRCASASTSHFAATVNSPNRISVCATNSPMPSAKPATTVCPGR